MEYGSSFESLVFQVDKPDLLNDMIPYRCPKCGSGRRFTTLRDLKLHLEKEHAFKMECVKPRSRTKVFNHGDIKKGLKVGKYVRTKDGGKFTQKFDDCFDTRANYVRRLSQALDSGDGYFSPKSPDFSDRSSHDTSSSIFKSYDDEAKILEMKVKMAKEKEMTNRMNRNILSKSKGDNSTSTQQRPSHDQSELPHSSKDYSDNQFLYQKPTKAKTREPLDFKGSNSVLFLDRTSKGDKLHDTLHTINNELLHSRHSQWQKEDALYQAHDVLKGMEQAAENRCLDQQEVIRDLVNDLRSKDSQLSQANEDLERLRKERQTLLRETEELFIKADSGSKTLKEELNRREDMLEDVNEQLHYLRLQASSELERKEDELSHARDKVKSLDHERQQLVKETQNLLKQADKERNTLKQTVDNKESKLRRLNTDMSKLKREQEDLVQESVNLYEKANEGTSKLKHLLETKDNQLQHAYRELEEMKDIHEKLIQHSHKLTKQADTNSQKLTDLLKVKEAELDRAVEELNLVKKERAKMKVSAKDMVERAGRKDLEVDKLQRLVDRKGEQLTATQRELESLKSFLNTAAEKEVVARNKLESFINSLIERADKAESELSRLQSSQSFSKSQTDLSKSHISTPRSNTDSLRSRSKVYDSMENVASLEKRRKRSRSQPPKNFQQKFLESTDSDQESISLDRRTKTSVAVSPNTQGYPDKPNNLMRPEKPPRKNKDKEKTKKVDNKKASWKKILHENILSDSQGVISDSDYQYGDGSQMVDTRLRSVKSGHHNSDTSDISDLEDEDDVKGHGEIIEAQVHSVPNTNPQKVNKRGELPYSLDEIPVKDQCEPKKDNQKGANRPNEKVKKTSQFTSNSQQVPEKLLQLSQVRSPQLSHGPSHGLQQTRGQAQHYDPSVSHTQYQGQQQSRGQTQQLDPSISHTQYQGQQQTRGQTQQLDPSISHTQYQGQQQTRGQTQQLDPSVSHTQYQSQQQTRGQTQQLDPSISHTQYQGQQQTRGQTQQLDPSISHTQYQGQQQSRGQAQHFDPNISQTQYQGQQQSRVQTLQINQFVQQGQTQNQQQHFPSNSQNNFQIQPQTQNQGQAQVEFDPWVPQDQTQGHQRAYFQGQPQVQIQGQIQAKSPLAPHANSKGQQEPRQQGLTLGQQNFREQGQNVVQQSLASGQQQGPVYQTQRNHMQPMSSFNDKTQQQQNVQPYFHGQVYQNDGGYGDENVDHLGQVQTPKVIYQRPENSRFYTSANQAAVLAGATQPRPEQGLGRMSKVQNTASMPHDPQYSLPVTNENLRNQYHRRNFIPKDSLQIKPNIRQNQQSVRSAADIAGAESVKYHQPVQPTQVNSYSPSYLSQPHVIQNGIKGPHQPNAAIHNSTGVDPVQTDMTDLSSTQRYPVRTQSSAARPAHSQYKTNRLQRHPDGQISGARTVNQYPGHGTKFSGVRNGDGQNEDEIIYVPFHARTGQPVKRAVTQQQTNRMTPTAKPLDRSQGRMSPGRYLSRSTDTRKLEVKSHSPERRSDLKTPVPPPGRPTMSRTGPRRVNLNQGSSELSGYNDNSLSDVMSLNDYDDFSEEPDDIESEEFQNFMDDNGIMWESFDHSHLDSYRRSPTGSEMLPSQQIYNNQPKQRPAKNYLLTSQPPAKIRSRSLSPRIGSDDRRHVTFNDDHQVSLPSNNLLPGSHGQQSVRHYHSTPDLTHSVRNLTPNISVYHEPSNTVKTQNRIASSSPSVSNKNVQMVDAGCQFTTKDSGTQTWLLDQPLNTTDLEEIRQRSSFVRDLSPSRSSDILPSSSSSLSSKGKSDSVSSSSQILNARADNSHFSSGTDLGMPTAHLYNRRPIEGLSSSSSSSKTNILGNNSPQDLNAQKNSYRDKVAEDIIQPSVDKLVNSSYSSGSQSNPMYNNKNEYHSSHSKPTPNSGDKQRVKFKSDENLKSSSATDKSFSKDQTRQQTLKHSEDGIHSEYPNKMQSHDSSSDLYRHGRSDDISQSQSPSHRSQNSTKSHDSSDLHKSLRKDGSHGSSSDRSHDKSRNINSDSYPTNESRADSNQSPKSSAKEDGDSKHVQQSASIVSAVISNAFKFLSDENNSLNTDNSTHNGKASPSTDQLSKSSHSPVPDHHGDRSHDSFHDNYPYYDKSSGAETDSDEEASYYRSSKRKRKGKHRQLPKEPLDIVAMDTDEDDIDLISEGSITGRMSVASSEESLLDRLTPSRRQEIRSRRNALFQIFRYLDTRSLARVGMVCREWRKISHHSALWKRVDIYDIYITSEDLIALSSWCTKMEHLSLRDLKARGRKTSEHEDDYHQSIRATLEPGFERLLQVSESTLRSLTVINCDHVLTDKSIWSSSCYSRMIKKVTYLSHVDPLGPDVIWALGAGCGCITTLNVPPLYPCSSPDKFNNKCLQIISQCLPDLELLEIGGRQIDINGLMLIAKSCQRLHSLALHHVTEVTEDDAAVICFKSLRSISFFHTLVSSEAVRQFFKTCKHLTSIKITLAIEDLCEGPPDKKSRSQYKKRMADLQKLKKKPGLGNILTLNLMTPDGSIDDAETDDKMPEEEEEIGTLDRIKNFFK